MKKLCFMLVCLSFSLLAEEENIWTAIYQQDLVKFEEQLATRENVTTQDQILNKLIELYFLDQENDFNKMDFDQMGRLKYQIKRLIEYDYLGIKPLNYLPDLSGSDFPDEEEDWVPRKVQGALGGYKRK